MVTEREKLLKSKITECADDLLSRFYVDDKGNVEIRGNYKETIAQIKKYLGELNALKEK